MILTYAPRDKRLIQSFVADTPWAGRCVPLIGIDMDEHAYKADFAGVDPANTSDNFSRRSAGHARAAYREAIRV